jgi:uncharacterized protein (DUF983 family)
MASPDPEPPRVLPWRSTTTHHHTGWPRGYWRVAVLRGLRLRCPVCGKGELFRTYFRMYDHCPCCGVGFAREHGQWVGSLDIHTFVIAFALMIGAALTPPGWPIGLSLAVWGGAAILIPLVTFRFARGLWTAIVHLSGGVY